MKYIVISSFLFSLIFVGCATTARDTFYWGNYSLTLYDYKKNPDEMIGRTESNKIVVIKEGHPKIGEFCNVQIEKAMGVSLFGKII